MPSRVYTICNSYESGYGHGLQNDGLDLSKTPHADIECGEAYQIGYEAGFERLSTSRSIEQFVIENNETAWDFSTLLVALITLAVVIMLGM